MVLRKRWCLVAVGAGVCSIVVLILWLLVPLYVQSRLLPVLAQDAGLSPEDIRVRKVGLTGTDIGPVRLGLDGSRFLEMPSVQLDYSPFSLLSGKIDRLAISGLRLDIRLNDHGTAIVGFAAKGAPGPEEGQAPADLLDAALKKMPVGLSDFELVNALLVIHWRDHVVDIPLDMAFHLPDPARDPLRGEGRLGLRGGLLDLAFSMDTGGNQIELSAKLDQFDPGRFSDLLAAFDAAVPTTRLNMDVSGRFSLRPLTCTFFESEFQVGSMHVVKPEIVLTSLDSKDSADPSIRVKLASPDGVQWHLAVSPLALQAPLEMQIPRFEGHLVRQEHQWQAAMTFETRIAQVPRIPDAEIPFRLERPLDLDWELSVQPGDDGAVTFGLVSPSKPDTHARWVKGGGYGSTVELRPPRINIAGEYLKGHWGARYEILVRKISALVSGTAVDCPEIALKGQVRSGPEWQIDTRAAVSPLHVKLPDGYTVELPHNELTATVVRGEQTPWTLEGALSVTRGYIRQKQQGVAMGPLTLHLPLVWPAETGRLSGTLRIDKISRHSRVLGFLKGRVGIDPERIRSSLTAGSKLFPGLNVLIESEAGVSGLKTTVTIPEYRPEATIDLAAILPEAGGYTVSGRISAQAEVELGAGRQKSRGHVRIADGVIRHAGSQMAIDGVQCDLTLKDVMALRSAPHQRLQVAAMTMGKLQARDLDVRFQLEPGMVLFIEKAGLGWCRGGVQLHALRLTPDLGDVETTLFCDRLNLAMLLDQLSLARGSGQGTVNGRIPVHVRNGRLRFDNGFLYSTPGRTGTIRLSGTDVLLAGFPPGSPQHLQLDIATEALKDYSYNWAKVKLESQGNLLLASLQLDGKPNQPMPFGYDPQTGSLKRIAGKAEADFKGIAIDLNFKTPLDDILHYRGLLSPHNP